MPLLTLNDLSLDSKTIDQLYLWRTSPTIRALSFNQYPQTLQQFHQHFKSKYHSIQTLPPQGIFLDHQLVGVIYFEHWFKENECVLSIYLDPEQLGKKIGTLALEKAKDYLHNRGFEKVIAFVLYNNKRALKVFENAGFANLGPVVVPKYEQEYPAIKFCLSFKKARQTFVIAEAGSNCIQGSDQSTLNLAKIMIEKAYEAGADAVKFQLFGDIYVPNAGTAGYLNKNINDLFKQYALPPHLVPKLVEYARYLGIEWMCSFFSEEDFEVINPYVQRHKIASYEIRHIRLIEQAARCQKPLLLSTGAATLEDIRWAIDTFENNQGQDLTLLQCTAQYPAQVSGLHLRCIPELQREFKKPVGLSDHSAHPLYAPIAAVSLGAKVIEKHFTLHQNLPGPDHSFAIDCKSLKAMCEAIDETEKILGLAKKEIFPQEEELAAFARRGLQAIQEIKKGESFSYGVNVRILRPGLQRLGIHPKYIDEIEGKKAALDIPIGAGLQQNDIIW